MKISCNKGFTLIELIVSMAIVSVIMIALMSFFVYNLRTFNKSSEALDEQSNLRLVSYRLTNELRNIGYINLDNDVTLPSPIVDSYIHLDSNRIRLTNAVSTLYLADSILDDIQFSLTENDQEKYILSVTLVGGVHSYSTEILLNNIVDDTQMDLTDIDGGNFNSLQFNYSRPPLTIPDRYQDTSDQALTEFLLIHPESDTVKKDTAFTYTAEATGGVAPYVYSVEEISHTSGTTVLVNDEAITWTDLSTGDQLVFRVTVTDDGGTGDELSALFTINVTNSGK